MKSFKTLALTSLLLLSIGFVSVPATAAESSKRPCAEDMKKFCGDVKPGKGAKYSCMKQHEADLSPACKAHQEEMKAKAQKFHEACKGDVEKFCKDMKPGGGRMLTCLKHHKADVSEACRDQMKHGRDAVKQTEE